jgi:hypothetical protein
MLPQVAAWGSVLATVVESASVSVSVLAWESEWESVSELVCPFPERLRVQCKPA